mmetsp:Transcript_23072/g.27225  ORF Transcript_23072/g.27225 Transcript_23072/m.27225 type:complete len:271 (+) Transcript_23072:215-1027(+)
MLIIADEQSMLICRECGLPRATQAEKDSDITILALIGAGMHAQDAPLRQEVVHDRENAFLHFARVLSSEDHHFARSEVQRDRSARAHAFGRPVARESTGVVNRVVWFTEVGKFLLCGADQHVVHEEGVIGAASNDPDLVAIIWIPPCKSVKDIQPGTSVQVVDGSFAVDPEAALRQWHVDGSPPNVILCGWLLNDSFIQGRAPCLCTRKSCQCSGGQNGTAFLVTQRLVVQGSRPSIVIHCFRLDAKVVQDGHVRIHVVRVVLWQLCGCS